MPIPGFHFQLQLCYEPEDMMKARSATRSNSSKCIDGITLGMLVRRL